MTSENSFLIINLGMKGYEKVFVFCFSVFADIIITLCDKQCTAYENIGLFNEIY